MPASKTRETNPLKPITKPPHLRQSQMAPQSQTELKEQPWKRPTPVTKQPSQQQVYTKKMPHRSSKPIINWFQRKLAGTRRITDGSPGLIAGVEKSSSRSKSRLSGVAASNSRSNSRSVSSPAPGSSQRTGANGSRNHHRLDPSLASQRRTISLNDGGDTDHALIHSEDDTDVDTSTHRSSLARDSMWSPTSAFEADEDASLRPIPPSAPPSPSVSHSSASYLSNSRTFRSIAASTKPTTVLSIDLPPAGIGHIAQVPTTQQTHQAPPRFPPHVRSSSTGTGGGLIGSGASITFSALPPSPQSSSRPSSFANQNSPNSPSHSHQPSANMNGLQAPLYTAYHPRNNPRPSSPPMDNASVLTLASSAYAIPGARQTMGSVGSTALSAMGGGGGDSISHLGSVVGDGEGENTSQFILGDDDRLDADGERDAGASLRALRPRSSRRGSWESEVSGWSARILGNGAGVSLRSKSLWTSNSMKTSGPLSLNDGEDEDDDGDGEVGDGDEEGDMNMKSSPERRVVDDVAAPDGGGGDDGWSKGESVANETPSISAEEATSTESSGAIQRALATEPKTALEEVGA
ncbi:hypothetical protein BV22DRAFT_1028487 [Leucogyrophana mollusca]|uniref:Uncharacterized protein n=1 Tax=Leucogyrophana mollusca TaxID=85980 RepID=A0ACB8BZX1_9AGAM|nr:hypothetical protein BV22DRAFT_1028487 [Leucogyrophana mollusca]